METVKCKLDSIKTTVNTLTNSSISFTGSLQFNTVHQTVQQCQTTQQQGFVSSISPIFITSTFPLLSTTPEHLMLEPTIGSAPVAQKPLQ